MGLGSRQMWLRMRKSVFGYNMVLFVLLSWGLIYTGDVRRLPLGLRLQPSLCALPGSQSDGPVLTPFLALGAALSKVVVVCLLLGSVFRLLHHSLNTGTGACGNPSTSSVASQ